MNPFRGGLKGEPLPVSGAVVPGADGASKTSFGQKKRIHGAQHLLAT